jgi:hypothetical protein
MGRFHLPYELTKDQIEQFIFQRIEAIEQDAVEQKLQQQQQQQDYQDSYCKGNAEEKIGDLSNQVAILRRQLGKIGEKTKSLRNPFTQP